MQTSMPFSRIPISTLLLLILVTGCQPSNSQEPRKTAEEKIEDEYVVPKPSAKQMLESTAPDYVTPSGTQQECLGRLMFDVAKSVEWPVANRWRSETFDGRRFSKNVYDGNDRLRIGNVDVATVKVDERSSLQRFIADHESSTPSRINELTSRLRLEEDMIAERQKMLTTAPEEEHKGIRSALAAHQANLEELQANLALARNDWRSLNLGMPDSFGFWKNLSRERSDVEQNIPRTSIFYAYIERNGYIYAFKSEANLDKAVHQKEFLAVLKNFRPRAAGEIPKDLGICIPYGFIADDGKSTIFNRMSIRYGDAPGVLYTIQTSNVDPRLGPETTTLTAAGRALAGHIGGYEQELVDKHVTKKIGPQIVKIGALTAQQGGFAAQKPDKEGKPMNVYSVFTGYGGWQNTFVLPSILVDMRSYTRLEAPELTVNPPPFEQSMERLNALLKSIRLRPTEPPMPELANLPAR